MLSDEEIIQIAADTKTGEPGLHGYILPLAFAREIERAVLAKASNQVPIYQAQTSGGLWLDVDDDTFEFHETRRKLYASPSQAAAIPESTGIDFDFINDCLLTYKSQLYFDGAEGLRNKIDEQIAAISAASKPEGE